ncbi:TPA: TPM domain-containing protein [Burkholderia cepacia ATCC 25416]|nr:TPM domain-containing protein [Burkholderia cepacia ATCC 25416]HDR9778670.1 TPM domain-containing protein [Burkholderia cepacia ATCC 25416]HDR9785770.1 TPM domain-containing protein [Burkholderia cepacia ATCC 25416]HDR9791637.1 TPM domain-containing protein [Burkholderia cepacia ATCC 25416]
MATTFSTPARSACTHVAAAAAYPVAPKPEAAPPLQGRVTDTTGVLSAACASELSDRLAALEQRLGVQVAILLVGSTGQSTIEQFATTVFDQWKLGKAEVNNGLLLVAALNDHTVRIEVGYGLEGTIPDIVAGRIIRERIVPAFRENRIEAGISDALDALTHEMMPADVAAPEQPAPATALDGRDEAYETAAATAASATNSANPPPRDARAGGEKYQSNGLPERKRPNTGGVRFWFLLGVANVVLGVVAQWRKLRRRVALLVAWLVAAVVPVVMLPVGAIFNGNLEAMLGAAAFIPTAAGVGPCLLGINLFLSARVRKITAIVGGTLFMIVAIGREMDYSVGEVLSGIFGVLCVLAVIWAKLTGGGSSSSSSSSGSRSPSSSDSFRGGGGSSGGGGASGRW